ncbi:MAG: cell division protein FtsA [Prevotellaceae bacterium]|jgi:cell division protein FtsA|nr:cell division protein FtsA [Prevotellaceae bacterium]
MKENELTAIDFGTSQILAITVEVQENGAIKILAAESKKTTAINKGLIEQKTSAAFAVNELQKLLQNSSGIKNINRVAVSINARSMRCWLLSQSFDISLKSINQHLINELRDECFEETLSFKDKDVYKLFPAAYYIDGGKVENPVGKKGSILDIDYNAIIGKKEIKANLNECFDRTGILIEHCSLGIEALSTVLLEDDERKNGCALINMGAGTTTLAIYNEGALQDMIVVPLGAKAITADICELGINEKNAELLKQKKGVAMEKCITNPVNVQFPSTLNDRETVKISTRFLGRIIEARLEDMLEPIFFRIRQQQQHQELEAGIIITGGGSKLNGITQFIEEKTNMPVRYGNHSDWLADDVDEQFYDPQYAQLIGTIVLANDNRNNPAKQIETHKSKHTTRIFDSLAQGFINFFNEEEKKQTAKKPKKQESKSVKKDRVKKISTVRLDAKINY